MSITGTLLAAGAATAAALIARRLRAKVAQLERRASDGARALRDAERLRAALFEQGRDGTVVWNAAGRITQASDRAAALFGFDGSGLVGRELIDVVAGFDGGRDAVAMLTESADGERTLLLAGRRRDGASFPLELRVRAVDLSTGRQWLGSFHDATSDERVEAEQLRSESIRNLIDNLPDAVVLYREGRLVYLNRRAIEELGYERADEVLGRSPLSFVHPDEHAVVLARMRSLGRTGRTQPLAEERLLRRDGSVVSMDVVTVPIVFDGEPSALVIARDSTERRRLQARGALADRMASVGLLAAGVAHGINNPLAYVLANTEFVLEELPRLPLVEGKTPPVVDDMTRALAQAREGAIRIRDLVTDLSTFSRSIERPSMPVGLETVLDAALSLAANEIRHRARIVKQYGPAPLVLADPSRLAHAFMNLLVNAAHAIAEGDVDHHEIRVSIRTDEYGRAQVEIRDTGAGIPPELVGSVFDPFFTTKPVGGGSGLGLSITYEIVTSLGGSIQAESELGRGSVFRVTLPATAVAAVSVPSDRPRRPRVLIVDDEPLMLETCERILMSSYEVRTAESGRAALERLQAGERFDAILCDLLMPDMTGMELHRALQRTLPRDAERMIFVTGGAFTPRAQAFLDTVPNLRFEKPFDRERILAVLAECLSR